MILDAVALGQPLPAINVVRNASSTERSLENRSTGGLRLERLPMASPSTQMTAATVSESAPVDANGTRWKQDTFAISFFAQTHPPPIDDASFQLMAEGNFTAVGLFDHLHTKLTPELSALQSSLCEKYNLKCLLRLDSFKKAKDGSKPKLPQLSATQWGFYLADEPNAHAFPSLAQQVRALHFHLFHSFDNTTLRSLCTTGGVGARRCAWLHELHQPAAGEYQWGGARRQCYRLGIRVGRCQLLGLRAGPRRASSAE